MKKVLLIKSIVTITYYLPKNKIIILSKNITELKKYEFDKVNDELINEFIESTNEVKNIVNFCNKVAADTISKYNQLKQDFDNKKFNQKITNIHLDDMFTNGLRGFKEVNKKTNSFIDEAF